MLKIYGSSDDLVEVEGTKTQYDEIGCFEKDVCITFTDGTLIRVYYSKPDLAVWGIEVDCTGTAKHELIPCFDENADIYSDIFIIDAEIENVDFICV